MLPGISWCAAHGRRALRALAAVVSTTMLTAAGGALWPVAGSAGATPVVGTQLTALHACSCDYIGASVAVSGTTAVVGAPGAYGGAGRLKVYTRSGGQWTETATLKGGDTGSGDNFGASVAMSATTIVVGAPSHGLYAGRAYVFTRSGGTWTQSAELVGSTTRPGDWFGDAVAIAGTTAVVGAPEHADMVGTAYVFSAAGGTWSQIAQLHGTGTKRTDFGYSVAVDGDVALVGQPGTTGSGRVIAFSGASGTWHSTATLQASAPAAADDFGNAVALQGTRAVVGAWLTDHGAAYVFSASSGSWRQVQELQATDSQGADDLGASVALQGGTVVVGGVIAYGNIGVAYVFTGALGSMRLVAQVAPKGNDGGDFFSNKALALDGTTLLVGSPGHEGGPDGGSSGSAYIFSGSGAGWRQVVDLKSTLTFLGNDFGTSLALSGTTGVAGAAGYDGGAGRAFLITPDTAGTYTPTLPMVGFDTSGSDHFGASSAISGLTALVGAPGHGSGRAYVFGETTAVPFTRGTVRCLPGKFVGGHLFSGQCRAWTEDAELQEVAGSKGDGFGAAVAVSGSIAVVGAPSHGGGRAYVFSDAGGAWTQVATLQPADEGSTDGFGASVALDGTTAVVGAPGHAGGAAYVYTGSAGSWTQSAELTGSDSAAGDRLGAAVAVTAASSVVVGAPAHGGGSAYVFADSGGTWSQAAELTGPDTASGDGFGTSVGISGPAAVVGAPGHAGGRAYLFTQSNGAWGAATEVEGATTTGGDAFGTSTAISGDVALVGAPLATDNKAADAGSGYAFRA